MCISTAGCAEAVACKVRWCLWLYGTPNMDITFAEFTCNLPSGTSRASGSFQFSSVSERFSQDDREIDEVADGGFDDAVQFQYQDPDENLEEDNLLMAKTFHYMRRQHQELDRSKSFGNSVSKAFTDAVSKLEMGHDSRNKQFHKLFPCVPDTEPVINSYSCALVKDILLQGRLFVSENWLCFHSNIFMYEKQIALRFETISRITKERTAFVVPNAIGIHTDTEKHIFGSLLSRHSTYQLLYRVWKNAKGETESMTPDSSQQGESDGDDIPDNCDESSQSDDGLDGNANEIQNGSMLSSVGAHQRRESPRRSDLRSDLSSSHHSSPRQLRLTSDLPHSVADLAGRSQCSRFSHRHLAHMLCSVSIFKSIMRMGGALKRLPQYQPFLLLIGILLLCLTFSAAVLTIRIWRLQPHTTALPQTSPHESVHLESMGNMGDLFIAEQHKHQQKVSHIQDTLTANLQALLQVQSSLSSLHKRPLGDPGGGGGGGGGGGTDSQGRVSEANPSPSPTPQKGLKEDL
ncbi:uncharacterized protein [Diadema setosum]|uniref:uncharacterized protein n=1 Tax=Diadema setosum TaxID=31175 RepID=UPI003B3BBD96